MVERHQGREAFGSDPKAYDSARPGYPEFVYDVLVNQGVLGPGIATLEIGPGSGKATREVLRRGNHPYWVVESDIRFVSYLSDAHPELQFVHGSFESAQLPESAFDFGFAATSFHWLDEDAALEKIARLLRPGGVWAAWWNVFGDPDREDAFHIATDSIMGPLGSSPSAGTRGVPSALDTKARLGALSSRFREAYYERLDWSITLNPGEVRALYSTFSQIAVSPREERNQVLDAIEAVARDMINGAVTRNMVTVLYTARR